MTILTGEDDDAHDDEDKDLTDVAAINRSISVDNENSQTPDICTLLMTFLTCDEDDAHDDEDKDLTDDAAIKRSISEDNENPQTPDILH